MMSFSAVDRMMRDGCCNGVFPGAVLRVTCARRCLFNKAYGVANLYLKTPVTTRTVFDLASLTKPLATTLGIMWLVGQDRITPETSLGEVFSGCLADDKARITIRNLLCHNAGFADYHPYFRYLRELPAAHRESALKAFIFNAPLAYKTGERTLYSDLGFIVLGWVVATVANQSLDETVTRSVYEPLNVFPLCFTPLRENLHRYEIAATELCRWRRKLMVGEVHDDNAYIMGGVMGHAGLFGTASAVDGLLAALVDGFHGRCSEKLLSSRLIRTFFSPQPDSTMALGFDRPSEIGSSAGCRFSSHSIGHLGYTGVSFWVDLSREVIITLLTNRVHPSRSNEKIKAFRPVLHDAVMAAAGKA